MHYRTHLGSQVHNTRNGRIESVLIPELISCLRRDLSELQPDFLIVTGDIARPDSRDAVFAARDLMDSLGFPYYPMGGSSDFCYEQSRQWFTEASEPIFRNPGHGTRLPRGRSTSVSWMRGGSGMTEL